MIFEKGGKLYRRYDKELLCLEPYGKNGLRVRATQLSEFSDERLSALIEPEEKAEETEAAAPEEEPEEEPEKEAEVPEEE